MILYESLIGLIALAFGTIALLWSIPGMIMSVTVTLGSYKHIIFMDQQLAKDLNKYYDHNGNMRPMHQLSWAIGSRCLDYWVKYPFIRHRVTTDSKKFRVFMWVNAIGMWSYIILIVCVVFLKLTGFIP